MVLEVGDCVVMIATSYFICLAVADYGGVLGWWVGWWCCDLVGCFGLDCCGFGFVWGVMIIVEFGGFMVASGLIVVVSMWLISVL